MRKDKMDASGETRWWKLNTQRYGGKILAMAGILALAALALYIFGVSSYARIALIAAGGVLLILLLLVRIELYQDKRDNERYAKEANDDIE